MDHQNDDRTDKVGCMAKMIGNTAVRCEYGCCRVTGKRGKHKERRWIKRGKKENVWKLQVRT